MTSLKDMFFKLVPVEDDEKSVEDQTDANVSNNLELPIIQSQVQYHQATRPDMPVTQMDTSEDAKADDQVDVIDWVKGEIASRDKQIESLSAKIDQLIKYGAAAQTTGSEADAVLTPDAPEDYVPLRELDFVTKDGKF